MRRRTISIILTALLLFGAAAPDGRVQAAAPVTDPPAAEQEEQQSKAEGEEKEQEPQQQTTEKLQEKQENPDSRPEEEEKPSGEETKPSDEVTKPSDEEGKPSDEEWNESEELKVSGSPKPAGNPEPAKESGASGDLTLFGLIPAADDPQQENPSWEEVLDASIAYLRGDGGLLNEEFLKNVSSTDTDWAVFALARLGVEDEDYRAFLAAADAYVRERYEEKPAVGLDEDKATEWHRLALAVLAAGGDPTDVGGHDLIADGTYNCKIGEPWKQGINGAVWALLTLDSRAYQIPEDSRYTREMLISYLLEHQAEDGGWPIKPGDATDTDITSMAIQALAPYREKDEKVKDALERAWKRVLEAEEFDDMGKFGIGTDCEKVAQAIIACCYLDLDPATVIVASGQTLPELLALHICPSGGFYHDARNGRGANGMATHQALEALAAWERYQAGEKGLFVFEPAEPEEDAELKEQREALKAKIEALPAKLYLENKQTIERYQWELSHLGVWENEEEREQLERRLSDAYAQIKEREELVNTLDQNIWDEIDPLRIDQSDEVTVASLMQHYSSLSKGEQELVSNRSSLLEAADVTGSLSVGIIPSRVFQNMRSTREDFTYYGVTSAGVSYTYVFDADTVRTTGNVDAGVEIVKGAATGVPGAVAMVELGQQGSMNGSAKLSFDYMGNTGSYGVYRMNNEKLAIQSSGQAKVSLGRAEMTVKQGGRYWLSNSAVRLQGVGTDIKYNYLGTRRRTLQGTSTRLFEKQMGKAEGGTSGSKEKSSGSFGTKGKITGSAGNKRETIQANPVMGLVKAMEFEEIKGQDKNLLIQGLLVDGVPYTVIFNGMDIGQCADFPYEIHADCEYGQEIGKIAENPIFLCMPDAEAFPGKALITISMNMEEEGLLLFRYDGDSGKAEYVKRVTVSEGKLQFTLEKGGHYFMAKRVKASALTQEIGEDAVPLASGGEWYEAEELLLTGTGVQWYRKLHPSRFLPMLITLLAFSAGILLGRNSGFGRKKEALSRKNDES